MQHSRHVLTMILLLVISSQTLSAAGLQGDSATSQPTSAPAGTIVVALGGFEYELKPLVEAYAKLHPEVRVSYVTGLEGTKAFMNGRADILGYYISSSYSGSPTDAYRERHAAGPRETVVAYWPLAVAVNPANPIKSVSLAQLRKLFFDPKARWKDLGRPADGRLRMYSYYGDLAAGCVSAASSRTSKDSVKEDERLANIAINAHRAPMSTGDASEIYKAMVDDKEGILVWVHTRELAASGLKILPIVGTAGPGVLPTDPAALASGRYPLRMPLGVATHDNAPAHAQALVNWLLTPEAGKIMADLKITTKGHPTPVIHVTAGPTPTTAPDDGLSSLDIRFDAPIKGAVAILPTEPLSLYYLMGKASHQASHEQAITEAIAADGRLTMVNRTELARVLNERRLAILGMDAAPAKPIVSADIIVISHIVSEDARTLLRIIAVHGPTGASLGQLKLPIDPSDPTTFRPPLGQMVKRWWPGVLARLHASRQQAVWAMLDVFAPSQELTGSAQAIRRDLEARLATDGRVFALSYSNVDEAQQEMLLRILGLSRPSGGRFTPVADYLIDARMDSPGKLTMRLRAANLTVLAEETVTAADEKALQAAATRWLSQKLDLYKAKPVLAGNISAVADDDWARKQAILEMEIVAQIKKSVKDVRYDTAKLEAARAAVALHARRAAQLDPTFEEAAFEALPTLDETYESIVVTGENRTPLWLQLGAYERFLQTFPKSKHHDDVLYRHAMSCLFHAYKGKLPNSVDAQAIRRLLFHKGLADYALHMELYGGKLNTDTEPVMNFSRYLFWIAAYIELMQPDEKELTRLVDEWASRYDKLTDKAPHSDFLRLIILKNKKDKAAFLALLTKMQQRWPDRKHPQWVQSASVVDEMIFSLFPTSSADSSFQLWQSGKRGIGDLPKVGYKLEDDLPKYNAYLDLSCQSAPKELVAALRALGEKYQKVQPCVRLFVYSYPKQTNLSLLEDRRVLLVVGELPAKELDAIKELYREGEMTFVSVGQLKETPDSAPRKVSVLLPPGVKRYEVLDDFIRFAQGPKNSAAALKLGLTVTGCEVPQRPMSQPASQTRPIGQ